MAQTKSGGRSKRSTSRKYGPKASDKVGKAMHEMKRGKLKSGRSGKTVKSQKQAVAIGLSEARKEGGKVPKPKSSSKSANRKSSGTKSSGTKSSRTKSKTGTSRRKPAASRARKTSR